MAAHGEAGVKSNTVQGKQTQDGDVPIVYPLHFNKFMRRSSIGTPVRPQTPLLLSTLEEETALHAPRPYRSIPTLKTPPEDIDLPVGQRSNYISPPAHLHGTKKRCVRHGRHDHVRQGPCRRKEAFKGTRDMMAKSRSGSYIPTGQVKRRQMEVTSPWVTTMDPFRGVHDVLMDDADACPDCMQELDIKKREAYGEQEPQAKRRSIWHRSARDADGSGYTVRSHAIDSGRQLFPPASHCYITDLSPVLEPDEHGHRLSPPAPQTRVASGNRGYGRAWQETVYQHRRPDHSVRGIARTQETLRSNETTPDADLQDLVYDSIQPSGKMHRSRRVAPAADDIDDLVVSRKLKDGVNAVIVEHQGQLQRVILSPRRDVSELERLHQLSRELANVSNTLALTSARRGNPAPTNPVQYSVVIDRDSLPPQPQQRKAHDNSSIPDLLSLIDQAAGEIRFNSSKISDQFVTQRRRSLATAVGREQSLMNTDEVHETLFDMPGPAEQIAHRQGMEEALDAARGRMEAAKKNQAAPDSGKQQITADRPTVGGDRPMHRESAALNVRQEAAIESALQSNQRARKPQSQTVRDRALQTPCAVKEQPATGPPRPIPAVTTTKPTWKEPMPQTESPTVSSTQHAQPAPSGVRPTIEVQQDQQTSSITPTPAPTPRALPPAASQAQPEHHSYFHDLLAYNPFHRRTPQTFAPSDPTGDSFEAMDPLVAASKAAIPPPIIKQPSPYRHAPAAPTDLFAAQHSDSGVREQAQIVRAAMRMEKGKAAQEAAAWEREARRSRRESLATAAAASGTGSTQGKGKGPVRKGWFH